MFKVLGSLAVIAAAASFQTAYAVDWKKTLSAIETGIARNKKTAADAAVKANAEAAAANAASAQFKTALDAEMAVELEKITAKANADIDKIKTKLQADSDKLKAKYDEKLKKLMKGEAKEKAQAAAKLKAVEGNIARLETRKANVSSIGAEFDKVMAMPYKKLSDANKACEAISALNKEIRKIQLAARTGPTVYSALGGLAPQFHAAMSKRRDEVAKANKGLSCKTIEKVFDEIENDEQIKLAL